MLHSHRLWQRDVRVWRQWRNVSRCWALLCCPGSSCSSLVCSCLSCCTDNAWSGISEGYMHRLGDCLQTRQSAVNFVLFFFWHDLNLWAGWVSGSDVTSPLHPAATLGSTDRTSVLPHKENSITQLSHRNPHPVTKAENALAHHRHSWWQNKVS